MTIRTARGLLLLGATAAIMLGGCSTQTRDTDQATPLASMRAEARAVTIFRGDGSGPVQWSQAIAEMSEADIVLMGEIHNNALGNAVQQEMFEDILTAKPRTQLSMEFYERDEQVALDDYLMGITDREAFEQAADRTASNNPPAHERMIDAAKEASRPVIASNAPRRYVRLARTMGYDHLRQFNANQRALFDIPAGTPQGAYRDRFMEAMGGMGSHGDDEMIEGFLRSQSMWDATMAQSMVEQLGRGTPIVHVVGYFHAQFGHEPGGSELVDQLRARTDRLLNIKSCITLFGDHDELQSDDVHIADFVVYVGEPEARN